MEPDAFDPQPGATFDYDQCPASYNAALPGPTRYRVLINGHRAWEQSETCNLDLPGATHLVVIETTAELARIAEFLDRTNGIAHDSLWVGAVQRRTAVQVTDDWLGFDGMAMTDLALWTAGEPNDGGGSDEGNHEEQFAMIEHDRPGLTDAAGAVSSGALCECDGKRLDADVIATIEANRLPR